MAGDPTVGEIPEHWELTTLGEICKRGGGNIQTGPFGSQLHASDYVPVGVPSIMPVNIGENRLIEKGIARITEADADRLGKHRVTAGDIIYSRRGDVERRALVRDAQEGWFCSTGCLKVRLGNGVIDPEFASHYLGHPSVRQWIVRHAVGATMPNLNTAIMEAIPFALPPLSEQKAIAQILGAMDDKIELDRRMNATLEAMARALFQSWFVDFDPVRAKLDGRKPAGLDAATAGLFPAKFQESSLGPIPQRWNIGVLNDLTDLVIGGDWGSSAPSDEENVPTLCIRGADVPSLQEGGIGKMPTRFLKTSSLEKRRLLSGDLAVEISGGSPTQSTGRPVLVSSGLIERLEYPLVCSNFCRVLKLKSSTMSKFVYLWIRRIYDNGEFLQFENGTTGIKNLAFTVFAEKYRLVIPPPALGAAFDRAVSPLFERHQANGIQSRTLATLRDTLLPRLLSGELRVSEVERGIGRAV